MSDLEKIPSAEEQPTTLEELFSRDPLEWTDNDIDKIVLTLREQRTKFNLAEGVKQIEGKPRGKATPVPKAKPAQASLPVGGKLSLGDLGLLD